MPTDVESLALAVAHDRRIATRTIRRILKDIDEEMAVCTQAGESAPTAVRQVRDVMSQAYLRRLEMERLSLLHDSSS